MLASRAETPPGLPAGISSNTALRVEAPARLHLGFIDPSGSLGRRYGSLGLTIDTVATAVRVALSPLDSVVATPAHAASLVPRMREHVGALRRATGCTAPLAVTLEQAPPVHAGFGSGTQLALALGRAFADLHGVDLPTRALGGLLARGARSGVGIAAFDHGGLILDGGRGAGDAAAPLLARLDFPEAWRIVLALDESHTGLHGSAEMAAIAALPPLPQATAAELAHETLMRLLPSVADGDFGAFAASLTHIQKRLGAYFAPAQRGSMFTSPGVARFFAWLESRVEAGIGQSSWGPTGFAVVASAAIAECVIADARAAQAIPEHVRVLVVRGCNRGAAVTRVRPQG